MVPVMIFRVIHLIIRWFLALLGMLLVLFEEVLWALTGGFMRFFSRFAPIAALEDRVEAHESGGNDMAKS